MARSRGGRTSVFVTAPYESDERGELRAVLPTRCPFAEPGEDDCRLGVHHRRERKTGPCSRLDVVRCATHRGQCFTLYPAGHFPYGRTALARCSVAGSLLLEAETGQLTWDGTVLEAAQQAESGHIWPAHSAADSPAVRRSQGRRLEVAGRLLGVHPETSDGEREQIATRLGLPTMSLRSAAARWSVRWCMRGAAITSVLAALTVDASLLDRLLSAGYVAGLWSRPWRWEPPKLWVVARSAEQERRPPPPSTDQEQRSTNSRGAARAGPDPPSRPP